MPEACRLRAGTFDLGQGKRRCERYGRKLALEHRRINRPIPSASSCDAPHELPEEPMPPETRIEPDQTAIVAAIASGDATGDGRPLKRIDTNMSHIFLGTERVYKLKRSRRHPFADMSSAESRRRACEAEIVVNQALAPGLYEGVLPVCRDSGGIKIGGPGEAVDWVVVMHRFPDGALLEEIAEAGQLTSTLVCQAVAAIVDFHASSPPRTDVGHAADYRRIIAGLRRTESEGAAALGVRPASAALFAGLEREVSKFAPLIEARRKAGWVRRGHGDLHLRNICIWGGRVTPFDALEFNPALATTDVIYDVAFLLMDLRARALDQLANEAMNNYWDVSAQPEEGLALLPLFMALRAAVRMAVAIEDGDPVQAARYRDLGLDILQPRLPRLLAIGGLSGTGKSTLARALAPELSGPCGGRLLRTDAIRNALAGVRPTARLRDDAYEPAARAAIYRALAQQACDALVAGSSVIADATFRQEQARTDIERTAGARAFLGLWLKASATVRVGRVATRQGDISDATPAIALTQVEPDKFGNAWRVLNADRTITELADDVRRLLGQQALSEPAATLTSPAHRTPARARAGPITPPGRR
jgi:aminoglycoside phosphotransferase family enzyme/predicted kinase